LDATPAVIVTTPFLTIETLDQMALRFYVEESDLHYVQRATGRNHL
jgi:hypothetical protein